MTMLTFLLYFIAIFFAFMFFFKLFGDIWDAGYDRGYRQAVLDKKIAKNFKTREQLDPIKANKIFMN